MSKDKDIMPINDKGQRHGVWVTYWTNGKLMYKCFFHNDKRVGYEEFYWHNGKLEEKIYHI